jgi:hypothetical protein
MIATTAADDTFSISRSRDEGIKAGMVAKINIVVTAAKA